jgi:hypothetical protein
MDMSGFNIADRLNGKKRMDSLEAGRFTERLGLPVGWLDSPRTEHSQGKPARGDWTKSRPWNFCSKRFFCDALVDQNKFVTICELIASIRMDSLVCMR